MTPSSPDRRQIGSDAERTAADFLRQQGCRILDANVHFPFGEIDLVAEHEGTLVIVEVRARRASAFGTAAESITLAKRRRVYRAAEAYLQQRKIDPARPVRIDVVAIRLDPNGRSAGIEWIKDAFAET